MALGLYLHIPFCQAICSYCNFNRGLLDADLKRRYVDALEREIRGVASAEGPRPAADTVFFGGGTPSLLEPAEVQRLIDACRASFSLAADAEVTLETNPETATGERLRGFRQAGVTRLSFGVQSFSDSELKQLGRIHSAARAAEAIQMARAAGHRNVSLDLMFWLPGQTLRSWLASVDQAIELQPEHLSLYLLELYPNAPIKDALARGTADPQAADDDAAAMYLGALDRLDLAGYQQYEISNVARPGQASRHNVKYWQGESWRGFGCGAHSTVAGVRWKNVMTTTEYVARVTAGASIVVDERALSAQERFEERLFTGLRLSAGIDGRQIACEHGIDPWQRYGEQLAPFADAGLLWVDGERFGLTRSGMLVANEILTTFV